RSPPREGRACRALGLRSQEGRPPAPVACIPPWATAPLEALPPASAAMDEMPRSPGDARPHGASAVTVYRHLSTIFDSTPSRHPPPRVLSHLQWSANPFHLQNIRSMPRAGYPLAQDVP